MFQLQIVISPEGSAALARPAAAASAERERR